LTVLLIDIPGALKALATSGGSDCSGVSALQIQAISSW